MIYMEGTPLNIVNANGGPHFETDIQAMLTLPGCHITGANAWRLLRDADVPAADIDSLTVSMRGISDEVRNELNENGQNLRGITTGATYNPHTRHIAVYAGNIAALGLPNTHLRGEKAVHIVDRTIRLALGRFAHSVHANEDMEGIQDIMISSAYALKTPGHVVSPYEKMIRSALHEQSWPVFTSSPLAYGALFALANAAVQFRYLRQVREEVTEAEYCAARFEDEGGYPPIATYKPSQSMTLII
ncbi:MAG: hypothetical protein WAQ24_03255 [Candidatus Saccharimonadales bacterium]